VNLWGVIHGFAFCFGQQMVERGEGGHIVNTASAAAFTPSRTLAAYSTSKGGPLLMLTECLRGRARGPKASGVSAICPGFVDTGIAASTQYVRRACPTTSSALAGPAPTGSTSGRAFHPRQGGRRRSSMPSTPTMPSVTVAFRGARVAPWPAGSRPGLLRRFARIDLTPRSPGRPAPRTRGRQAMTATITPPIKARRVRFDWEDTPIHWVPGDAQTTHTMNVLHLLLPAGGEVVRRRLSQTRSH